MVPDLSIENSLQLVTSELEKLRQTIEAISKINEKSNEVKVANIALVDKNSTTLNGPKNSLRYSNTGNNIT